MTDIRDDRNNGRLEAFADGEVVGHIAYFTLYATPAALVPVHTVVDPGHEGQGIAGSLVRAFYEMAAKEGVPVVPLCPYAAKWAERHPEEAPAAPADLVRAAKEQLASDPRTW